MSEMKSEECFKDTICSLIRDPVSIVIAIDVSPKLNSIEAQGAEILKNAKNANLAIESILEQLLTHFEINSTNSLRLRSENRDNAQLAEKILRSGHETEKNTIELVKILSNLDDRILKTEGNINKNIIEIRDFLWRQEKNYEQQFKNLRLIVRLFFTFTFFLMALLAVLFRFPLSK